MRTYGGDARPSRTLAALIEDAFAMLRQDFSEYGYIGFVGACAAAVAALVLRMIDGPLALALIVVVVSLIAVGTLATCAAAVERANESLQPDPAASLATALARGPWLLFRWLPPAFALSSAVYVSAEWGGTLGALPTLAVVVALVFAGLHLALPVGLYVPALFARGLRANDAWLLTSAIMKSGRASVVFAWAVSIAPAAVVAIFAVPAQFGVFSTTVFAFAVVGSMPVAAAIMSMLFNDATLALEQQLASKPAPKPAAPKGSVAARLDRHVR